MKNHHAKVWVEDEDLIRRGVLRASHQRASYDREGRYFLNGKVFGSIP